MDRLDYTKGIVHRLRAYGELLDEGELDPRYAVLVQVASPSRERVEEYQRLRDEVEGIVGRINGDHSSVGKTAIHYLHQSFSKEEMAALYLAADVMLVTPLRDGMNLVAKEYVACHFDLRGALVLSEFTGAADELRHAFLINPYDIDGTKAAILQAVRVSPKEAARRMQSLRRRVIEFDVHHWANTFLGALDMVTEAPAWALVNRRPPTRRKDFMSVWSAATARAVAEQLRPLTRDPAHAAVLCDIDGTLAPIVERPSDARLPEDVSRLLGILGHRYACVACVSGRPALQARRLVGEPSIAYAGLHGAELLSPDQEQPRLIACVRELAGCGTGFHRGA